MPDKNAFQFYVKCFSFYQNGKSLKCRPMHLVGLICFRLWPQHFPLFLSQQKFHYLSLEDDYLVSTYSSQNVTGHQISGSCKANGSRSSSLPCDRRFLVSQPQNYTFQKSLQTICIIRIYCRHIMQQYVYFVYVPVRLTQNAMVFLLPSTKLHPLHDHGTK